jgi:hypothetical protein
LYNFAGCKVDPHKKQLHLTLAYQFLASHQSVLEAMAKKVNPKAPARWELRIYSRDARMAQGEVKDPRNLIIKLHYKHRLVVVVSSAFSSHSSK